jgi:hypothetical protein
LLHALSPSLTAVWYQKTGQVHVLPLVWECHDRFSFARTLSLSDSLAGSFVCLQACQQCLQRRHRLALALAIGEAVAQRFDALCANLAAMMEAVERLIIQRAHFPFYPKMHVRGHARPHDHGHQFAHEVVRRELVEAQAGGWAERVLFFFSLSGEKSGMNGVRGNSFPAPSCLPGNVRVLLYVPDYV